MSDRSNHDPGDARSDGGLPPYGTIEPVRRVDPAAFLPGFDDRHHHVDLRRGADRVTGRLDAVLLPRLLAWAEEEGLAVRLDGRFEGRGMDGGVEAVVPRPATVARAVRLRARASPHAGAVTEVRLGAAAEVVAREVFAREGPASEGEWRRIRSGPERYLGWIRAADLALPAYAATHRFGALRGHLYAAPRVEGEVLARAAWGDRLRVVDEHRAWSEVRLPDGRAAFVAGELLSPLNDEPRAPVLASWRAFLGTLYLWGGGSAWGIDCSGFTQLLLRMAGRELPRDTDEQYAYGRRVDAPEPGDLACFRGHVGLYLGGDRMAHASGRAMQVVETAVFATDKDRERFQAFVRVG